MKQIIQSLKDGTVTLADVPAPGCGAGEVLIRTRASLISVGTEKMLLEFGRAGWMSKARQQPDKVRQTLDKVRTDGLGATVDAVRSKLDQPITLGYCNVGDVIDVGAGVRELSIGDRVVSNGPHAEVVAVPQNLCAKVPEGVPYEQAAFTVMGAIGLQGIRLAKPTLGECVAVIGLGLIGLLTVQMLRAQGCRVLGVDVSEERLALAQSFGADVVSAKSRSQVLATAEVFSRGRGVDAVLITAATDTNEPVTQAAQMSRVRGRIVLVGVADLKLARADFYEKELSFQVSCSYGPGRYDRAYEEGGQDYPIGHVRWTEQRNMEAVLDQMAAGALDLAPLVTRRVPFEKAANTYDDLDSALGIVLEYPDVASAPPPARAMNLPVSQASASSARIAILGAGNYGGRVLIPAFKAAGATLQTIVSAKGVSAAHFGAKYGFHSVSTDADAALSDDASNIAVIATRHNAHAGQVLTALSMGKHVYVEKPLCLTSDDLTAIEAEMAARPTQRVMVGFNRRFAPLTDVARKLIREIGEPKAFIMTVNAGALPADDWQHDPAIGGGRIVGEGCHFIDLLRFLADAPVTKLDVLALDYGTKGVPPDRVQISLGFADGSTGTIHYLANGNRGVAKERLEVFGGGRVLQLDNFRVLRAHGFPGLRTKRLWRQDKGNAASVAIFCRAIETGAPCPIPPSDVIEVSRLAIEAQARAAHGGRLG